MPPAHCKVTQLRPLTGSTVTGVGETTGGGAGDAAGISTGAGDGSGSTTSSGARAGGGGEAQPSVTARDTRAARALVTNTTGLVRSD
jgi:hypothetical protein